jgi:hypothetical protein
VPTRSRCLLLRAIALIGWSFAAAALRVRAALDTTNVSAAGWSRRR